MAETDSPSKTFIGVRFVLFGFDLSNESKVRSKLQNGGGIDAGHYNQNPTHVIVDNVVYDDPICVMAKKDGKALVTGLWVDHSFDIGAPVDPNSIIYQPLRDLNGIRGATNLIICLTGYQRQDREDIMTMVGLMGAQFSKPLVANKVTHLICYKFEGEKYELAKKMKKIKLVNHRWLEDCLRDWKILSEDNYSKSGYELEMMEAEAKDSEEDADEIEGKKSGSQNANDGTNQMCNSEGFLGVVKPNNNSMSPGRMNRVDLASGSSRLCLSEMPSCQDVITSVSAASVVLPDPQERTPKSIKVDNDFKSIVRSTERSPHSSRNLSALSYKRKTPRRSPNSIFSGESHGAKGSPEQHIGETINTSAAKASERGNLFSSGCNDALNKVSEFLFEEALNDKNQKTGVSCPSSLSRQPNSSAKAQIVQSASESGLEPKSLVDDLSKSDKLSPFSNHYESMSDVVYVKSIENLTMEIEQEEKTNSRSDELVNGLNDGSDSELKRSHVVVDEEKLLNHKRNKGMTSSGSANSREMESNTSTKLGKAEDESSKSITRPLSKKNAKKFLGSRPKLTSTVNQKGSIYLNKIVSHNDPAKLSNVSELEAFPGTVKDAAREEVQTNFASAKDIVSLTKTHSMDEETEAPEEKEESGVVLIEEEVALVNSSCTSGQMKQLPEEAAPGASTGNDEAREGNISAETQKIDESTSNGNGRKRNASKVGRFLRKAVTKSVLADTELAKSKMTLDGEETYNPKEVDEKAVVNKRGEQPTAGQTKNKNTTGKKLRSSGKMEKENNPLDEGDQNLSHAEEFVAKTDDRSSKIPVKINQKDKQEDQNSTPKNSVSDQVRTEPVWFILSGHKLQRKEFHQVIRRLKGKLCRVSHHWSYQATHFIAPDPIRRTEKFFAAAASGRWILKTDYLTASNQAGKFLPEEPYEWHKKGLSEDGAINLEAPRKWRLLRARTGHGAFYGMRIVVYGECIAPSLDTLKRVVKAGDGTIIATSPPYSRFLKSEVDYAVISAEMPRVDMWVQEFLKHEIPCIVADYLVDYVCKPGYSLERHVLYNTHAWAEKSFANVLKRADEIVEELTP